jgi:uncharacterized DUF497 family protein
MRVIWDAAKDRKLTMERGLSLETFAALILEKKYLAILKNPARKGQRIFVIFWQDYTYIVLFVIDDERNIVLKTVFPSKKYHKMYGGKNERKT